MQLIQYCSCIEWFQLLEYDTIRCDSVTCAKNTDGAWLSILSLLATCSTLARFRWSDPIQIGLCTQVFKCQHSMAPGYLAELCRPVSSIDGHQHLWSAHCSQLDVPRVRLSTYGGRVFCHAGPSAWNAIPVCLNNTALSLSNCSHQLKHFYFSSY